MKALFDTNILVDYLCGIEAARNELALYEKPLISLVTWMEVLVGASSPDEEGVLRSFLERFELVEITRAIAERAVSHRRASHVRLPDALIWATAQEQSAVLVTRNTRDFPESHPGVRVPYRI